MPLFPATLNGSRSKGCVISPAAYGSEKKQYGTANHSLRDGQRALQQLRDTYNTELDANIALLHRLTDARIDNQSMESSVGQARHELMVWNDLARDLKETTTRITVRA
jgi:hypothetical protein